MNKSTVQGHTLTREKVQDTSLVGLVCLFQGPLCFSSIKETYVRRVRRCRAQAQDTGKVTKRPAAPRSFNHPFADSSSSSCTPGASTPTRE
jgi:hypothetical protein